MRFLWGAIAAGNGIYIGFALLDVGVGLMPSFLIAVVIAHSLYLIVR